MNIVALRLAAGLLLALSLGACSAPGPQFTILSGSENDVLEPMVQEFCQSRRASCTVKYQGSLDIALALKAGNDPEADAVWPAASIWIDMFDTARRVKSVKSIAQMPVILGVKRSKAQELGWVGAKVTTKDILAAVEGGRLKFLMTSATQSNSGASAYLAMLAAGIGKPDLIESGDLDKPEVLATVRGLLRGVERSSGSSGWLADLYREGERTAAGYRGDVELRGRDQGNQRQADRRQQGAALRDLSRGWRIGGRLPAWFRRSRARQGGRELFRRSAGLPAQGRYPGADRGDRAAGRAWPRRPAQGRRHHQSRPEPRAHGGPAAGARRHSEGAVALPGSAAATFADRLVYRCVWKHEGARRRAIARSDAIPADAGAHPRGAGAMVEAGPDRRAAIQRSRAVDRDE